MNRSYLSIALTASLTFFVIRSAAAVGNDNPLGPAGEYNGSITTGGSYDPYTGNAKRFTEDLTVTGSLGAYPLKWTRILNTRNTTPWTHSYDWHLWLRSYEYYQYHPEIYDIAAPGGGVTYPDGRILNFAQPQQPNVWFVDPSIGDVQDRLVPVPGENGNFYLLMRDGGKVKFEGTNYNSGAEVLHFIATQITDPYELTTLLKRDGAGRLWQIVEPGGRYLQLNYTNNVLTSVQAFSGPNQPATETVSYDYEGINYKHAYYDDGSHATYTYGLSNNGSVARLIRTCDDVRFAGPMRQIKYEYVSPLEGGEVAHGQIKREKNFNDEMVSEVTYCHGPGGGVLTDADFQRIETRGDWVRNASGQLVHPTRLFQYSNDGHAELKSYTDFKGQFTEITYPVTDTPLSTYRKSVKDARMHTSSVDMELNAGAVMKITHPPTYPGENSTVQFTYTDTNKPYYVESKEDENHHKTRYTRDPISHRVTRIDYPDGGFEEFLEFDPFGQVMQHRLTSGGIENFRYDGRGRKTESWPPATQSDPNPEQHKTLYFYYDSGPTMSATGK